MSQRARREAKKAGAKSRQQQQRSAEHNDSEFFDDDASAAGSGATGGAAQSAPPPGAGAYTLWDGREDLLLYWQSELTRSQKEEALHISDEELGRALQRAAWGHGDASASLAIDPRKLAELRENAELMTAARCIFVDAVYAEGKARSMGDAVAAASSSAQAQADAASLDLILHSILGVIERKVLLCFERENFYLRVLAIVLFWIWSWSDFGWIVRYTLIIALGFVIVAASNAAATLVALSTRLETDPEIAALSPFWERVGQAFLKAKRALIAPFDDPSNPILLRARTDIALSALLVIDHASWVFRGRFILLLIGSLILPSAILLLEKGGGGWNRSIDSGRSARAVDAQGLRWLRVLSLSLSHCIAIYYSGGSGWTSFVFVSGFFFPSATTIALSSLAVVVTGTFILLSRLQSALLGEFARRALMYWAVWLALLASVLTGHAGSGGWMWYLCSLLGLALFLPPLVSFAVQITFGGVCSLLLSVGLIPVCKVLLQIMQLLLTRKGVEQMIVLVKGSLPLVWELCKTFIAGLRAGATAPKGAAGADFSSSASSSGASAHAEAAEASAAAADSNSEMN